MLHVVDLIEGDSWRKTVAKQLLYHQNTSAYNHQFGMLRANLLMSTAPRIIGVFQLLHSVDDRILQQICFYLNEDAVVFFIAEDKYGVAFAGSSLSDARKQLYCALDGAAAVAGIPDISFAAVESWKYHSAEEAVSAALMTMIHGRTASGPRTVLDGPAFNPSDVSGESSEASHEMYNAGLALKTSPKPERRSPMRRYQVNMLGGKTGTKIVKNEGDDFIPREQLMLPTDKGYSEMRVEIPYIQEGSTYGIAASDIVDMIIQAFVEPTGESDNDSTSIECNALPEGTRDLYRKIQRGRDIQPANIGPNNQPLNLK